jgi:hypothetical protein
MLVFSDGALIVGERIRFPERISCVQRWEEGELKRSSPQGRMSWIVSGFAIGLVERNDE